MASQGRFQSTQNAPNFDHDSSMTFTKSKPMLLPRDTLSPQLHTKNMPGASNLMDKHQSLSSPPSAKSLRSRRMLEELVGENTRLRVEVETSCSQQASKFERMVTELVKLRSELRAKDVQIADQHQVIQRQNTELTQLRTDADITLEQFQKLRLEETPNPKTSQLQQIVSELRTEIREKDLNMREKDQMLREREFEIRSMIAQLELQLAVKDQDQTKKTSDDTQLESEVVKVDTLQEEIRSLKTALAALELQLQSEKSMSSSTVMNDKYLQEIEQQTAAYGQLKSQMEAQEARSQKLTQELNTIQASSQRGYAELRDQMQVLEQREQEHAQDVAEARQAMNFFKRNSEASTRKVKGLEAEVKSLMQSLQTSDGAQIGNSLATSPNAAPGAWPGTDGQGIRSSASLRRKPLGNSSIT